MGRKLVFLVIVLININLFANWVAVEENSTKKMFEVSSSNPGSTEFDFSLKGYEQETIIENGISYERISFENEGQFLNVGKPDLPRFTKLIAIENEGEISVVVNDLNEEIITGITVYPRQNLKKDNEEYDRSFMIDNDYYSSGDVYPAKIVEAGEPAIMRDLRIVSVTINPFRFDPQNKELRIIKNISVTVNCSGRNGENIKLKNSSKSRFFEPLYKASILNYEHIASREEVFQDPSYLFIYPSIMTGNANLQALLDWKHQKGFVVNAASTTETGTSNTEIKSYIQNAYDNWSNPPEFICLVGDAGGTFDIPTWFISGGEGDHPYTQLEGGDILADAYIGRLSFNSYTEFDAIVYKILYYEKEPYITETDWYEQAQLVGDPASSDQSTITTCKTVKEIISAHSDGYSFDEIYFGDYDGSMMTSYNDGVGYSCYRGYLGMSGWGTDDIDNMTNDHKLPFALHLTCGTGDFEGTSDSRSERFLKVGTWNAPKGAIGAIGTATMGTHTTFNNCVTAGTFYGVFTDEIFNMGGALVRGKLHLYNSYPDNPSNFVDIFSYWDNLMGDPGLELWTGVPQPLTVIYDTDIPLGSNVIEVTVETSTRAAIEGAWVTALLGDDEIFSTGYTDSAGKVYLPIDADTEDTVTLTVTKHNYIPHLGSFDISQETSFVNVYETTIDDDNSGTSSGNNDGLINPGEDIELEVSLINDGTGTAYSVAALISSASSIISITDNTETYGTITAGNSTYSADDFDFSVAADALGGTEIILDVAVTEGLSNEWNDKIYLTVSGPNLDYDSHTVSDGGNGILDPAETSDLIVTIENMGTETASNVYGILSCSNSLITVSDDQGYFGSITSGSQASNTSNRFEVSASSQIAEGTQFTFELQLYNSSGYDNTITFDLEVGSVSVTDPLGPDTYGYFCYDDGDTGHSEHPTYSWVEIDPDYGGSGTIINMNDNGEDTGDLEDLDLPFALKFYGNYYSTISICSNGFIAPGSTEQVSAFNWPIPGPMGPSPMIAPFWDDLWISSGNVCYLYDPDEHYFIVEWSNLVNEGNSSFDETFQAIIYDQNYYPTLTGDSDILYQYKEFNNVDSGTYRVSHGQYSTIGIEDQTSFDGLEYTYDNDYPTAAKTLDDDTAILFTTNSPTSPADAELVLGVIGIDDTNANGKIENGETVDLTRSLINMGLSGATGISAVLSSSDPYIMISQNSSNYNNISAGNTGANLSDYTFTVDSDCPDGRYAEFDLVVTSNEGTWNLDFQVIISAVDVDFQGVVVVDGDDNILDPDETANLIVTLVNNGGADAADITSILSSTDQFITINTDTDNISSLTSGSESTVTYNITTSASVTVGHTIYFDLEISTVLGYSTTGAFGVTVGMIIEDFETGDFSQFSWEFDGNLDWTITSSNSYEGTYCARSGSISDNQTSEMYFNADVASDGTISFYRSVSSEGGYDYLEFYIDDVLQERWAGTVAWEEESYPVSAGTREFRWIYDKDGSVSSGSDCGWIDYINFPPVAPPADISVDPSTFTKTLAPEGSTTDDLTIGNTGGTILEYSASVNYSSRRTSNVSKYNQNNKMNQTSNNRDYAVIGNGANSNGGTTITPFSTYWHDGNHHYLFSAAELSAAGITSGDLNGIGFNISSVNSATMNGFNIGIKHTTATTVTGFETGFATVYTGSHVASVGWNDFAFSSAFNWDGTSNVLVKVCFDNTSYTSNSTCYYDVYADNMTGYAYNDYTAGCTDSYEGNTTSRPQVRFDYTAGPTLNWLTLDGSGEATGSIDPGNPDDVITVAFDTVPDNLAAGIYEADITISSNDPENPTMVVPVTLNVEESIDPPDNLTISEFGDEIIISWDAVTGANSYKVYSDTNPYGSFTNLEEEGITSNGWTDENPGIKKFYRVIASTETRVIDLKREYNRK